MTAKIISGREVAEHILEKELSVKVKELKEKNIVPNLVVILVGEMKASASYVAQKEKFAAKAGIKSEVRRFTAEISEEDILSEIDKINNDSLIHGVIVQLPLPDHRPRLNQRLCFFSRQVPLRDASLNVNLAVG